MPHKTIINAEQLLIAVFLCLICDSLIRPITGGAALSAYGRVFSAIVSAALVFLLFRPVLKVCQRETFTATLAGTSKESGIVLVLLSLCFLEGAARSLQQSEMFYRYVSGETLQLTVFLTVILLACIYAAYTGVETLMRTGTILAFFLAGSIFLIVVGNAPQMRIENLQIPQSPIQDTWTGCVKGFNLTPELLLLGIFSHSCKEEKTTKILTNLLILFVLSDFVLTILSELVLGAFEALQVQPIHTLARLGGISVFRRLDALHVSVWLLVSVFRTALLCAGLGDVLRPLFSSHIKHKAVLFAGVPIFFVARGMYYIPEIIQQWGETALVFAAAMAILVLVPKGEQLCIKTR